MSRQVTQSAAEEISVYLTSDASTPASGLTATDVVVEYSKNGAAFVAKDLTAAAAVITSANTETFALVDGQTLTVSVDGGGDQTATFNTADFVDINAATAAEIVAVITTDITGVTPTDVAGAVRMTSTSTGDSASIQVTGGTANTALGFSTDIVNGVSYFKEVGSGVYLIEFTAVELNTLGNFIFKVNGSAIQQYVGDVTVVASAPSSTVAAIDTCILTGHVLDIKGDPVVYASISGEVLAAPAIINGVGVSSDRLSTLTSATGEFFLELARGAYVEVRIPEINYKRRFTVPNSATANLFSEV